MKLSTRCQNLQPSATFAVAAKAESMRADGKNVISLSQGEPDFDTPDFIKAAGKAAIDNGQTKYTAVDGTPELKAAIRQKLQQDHRITYTDKQIIVSSGAKSGIYSLCQATLEAGDEVIIPAPYWVSYPPIVELAGGKPIILPTTIEQSLKITAEQLETAITPNTRLFILNTPNNPSGMTYTMDELSTLAQVLRKHPQIQIVSDDIYEYIVWQPNQRPHILHADPTLAERTFIVNGVSKAYAMTGWRIGYTAGPAEVIAGMKKIQSQDTSNPCSISQAAALAALEGGLDSVHTMVKAFKKRHDFIMSQLQNIAGIQVKPSQGTFYSFPDVSQLIARLPNIHNDVQLCEFFIEKALVALVPGSAFGSPNHVRLSYAASMEQLEQAMRRIQQVITA